MKKLVIAILIVVTSISFAQQKRAITVEDLWSMKRVETMDLSPNGKTIAFVVSEYSMEENKGQSDIWLINSDGTNLRPLKNSEVSEGSPKFHPDGKLISYSYKEQFWICDLDGKNDKQLTDLYTGASGLVWANDGTKFLFVSSVYPDCNDQDCNKKKDEAKAADPVEVEVFTELMYRHWNDWRGPLRSHLFLMDVNKNEFIDLTLNSKYDAPPIALGSGNDFSISPDGKETAFTMNTSDFLATSTNNDIFIVDLSKAKKGVNSAFTKISVSEGNDTQPVYSPDGKYIAFTSMARAGFEADKKVLVLYNRETKKLDNVSENLDMSFGELVWSPDSKFIYYTANNEVNNSIYKFDISKKEYVMILEKRVNSNLLVSTDGSQLVFKQQRSNQPYEIFSLTTDVYKLKQLTYLNKELLAQLEMNDIKTFWSEGADGAKVQTILVLPPFFDESKKYPMMFMVHGGPQGHTADGFHYRWNLQMFASRGYVVLGPNPRGSTGYGQKFTDEISRDWGGKVYVDLMNAYDYAIDNFTFIDKENTFACGASYGGYMMNWIEGHTDRFNALFCHDGVYNLESMYGTTEELWFPEWDNGGTPWDNPDLYRKWSPSSYVKNFKTPMLIVHGGMDFRVPEGQAFELFTALQKMGVESKFVYFPKETHFVLKPQNARFWWNTVYDWFNIYTR